MAISTKTSAIGAFHAALTAYLKANMPSVKNVQDGWPAPNQKLVYPSITIVTKIPKYTALSPYVVAKEPVDVATGLMKYVRMVGMYDLAIQLDIWTAYKPQRDLMVQELIQAFNKNVDVPGIHLELALYFNEPVHLAISSVQYLDDEQAVQRDEWRAMITVLSNLRVLSEETGYPMQNIESVIETPALPLVEDPVPDGISII